MKTKVTKELAETVLDPKFKSLNSRILGKLLKLSQSTVFSIRKAGSYEGYVEWAHRKDLRRVKTTPQPQEVFAKADDSCPFKIGGKYFFRTVTYFATGRVVAVHGKFLELTDGAWIADTGRFADAFKSGDFSEVEPVEVPMFLNIDSITDAFVWLKDLPRSQK